MVVLLDSLPISEQSSLLAIKDVHPAAGGNYSALGQSFTTPASPTYEIDSAKFSLKKSGAPTGNLQAQLYAHSGTFGSSSKPTGAALAVSDPVNAATLTTTSQAITFNFTGANRVALAPSTHYCIEVVGISQTIDGSNYVRVGIDFPSSHDGNLSFYSSGTWQYIATFDSIFYVYGAIPVYGGEFGLGKTSLVMTL